MAPPVPGDPPTSVREKGGRLVVVFNVANVRPNSVQVEVRPPSDEEPAGSVHVSFSSMSPSKAFVKHLVLPHGIDSKTVQDVQSKSLTLQLVKLDESLEWGQAWLKPKGKTKRKGEEKADAKTGRPPKEPEQVPETTPAPPSAAATPSSAAETAPSRAVEVEEPKVKEEEIKAEPTTPETPVEVMDSAEAVPVALAETAETAETVKEEPETPECVDQSEPNSKAGVKARARRGKKKPKEKVEEASPPVEVKQVEQEVRQTPTPASKEQKSSTATAHRSGAAPIRRKSDREEKRPHGPHAQKGEVEALIEALKAGPLKDYPLVPPTDPELRTLVGNGSALLSSDPKKALVFLRLAGRKGYLPAYLLLAQHAQLTKDDGLLIESLCTLFMSPDVKQLPKNLLSNCAMQLTAVLRDPKNQQEAAARAADLEVIAKDWPIMNMLKLQTPGGKSASKQAKTQQGRVDFQQIKEAMVTPKVSLSTKTAEASARTSKPVRGTWQQVRGRWHLSVQVPQLQDVSTATLEVSEADVRLSDRSGHAWLGVGREDLRMGQRPIDGSVSLPGERRGAPRGELESPEGAVTSSPSKTREDLPESDMVQISLGVCWCPSDGPHVKWARVVAALQKGAFEALLVSPDDNKGKVCALAMVEAAKAMSWELRVIELKSGHGDQEALQKLCHELYTDRCVAQEQSCLLLLSDRRQAEDWLRAVCMWFLGRRPQVHADEEPFWLLVELNRFTVCSLSPGLRLERSKGDQ
ncbi:Uncharacterized protein SCF082_LOCUS27254 [Durusdinium trenchii]|uniref:CS domain-containing protein n=1 Tax=Durusdinium trenchii TaxID=1381693 RepID=A0ABP0MD57_9DINO